MNKHEKQKNNEEQKGIDANKVIAKLTQQVGGLAQQMAVLQVRNEDLQHVVEKQNELIEKYEDKLNAKK